MTTTMGSSLVLEGQITCTGRWVKIGEGERAGGRRDEGEDLVIKMQERFP